jgi:hypothetical protein
VGIDRKFRIARVWSNRKLRRVGSLFSGEVVNVSAGEDVDKEGGGYREYFPKCSSYSITNHAPGSYRGFQGKPGEIELDLTAELPTELAGRFDVVFNHTTLEHVFDVRRAFANLCEMTRDIVIVVVPFAQVQHETEDFGDFWRFTPTCLRALADENGLTTVYETVNRDVQAATYLLSIASRHPERWAQAFPPANPIMNAADWIGNSKYVGMRAVVRHLRDRFRPRG